MIPFSVNIRVTLILLIISSFMNARELEEIIKEALKIVVVS